MRIGILGSGDVGKALARGFSSRGHDVAIGSREPRRSRTRRNTAKSSRWRSHTTGRRGPSTVPALQNFAGKPVMDATNPLHFEAGKLPALSIGRDSSAGEEIQRMIPGARVVKCFNTIGNGLMADPQFEGGPPSMFICGNDEAAKKTVTELVEPLGRKGEVLDAGGIEISRYSEPLAMLWIAYGIKTGSWTHAFKLLR